MKTMLLALLLAIAALPVAGQTVYVTRPKSVCFFNKSTTVAQLNVPAGSYHVTAKTVLTVNNQNADLVTCTLYSPATTASPSGFQDSSYSGAAFVQNGNPNSDPVIVNLDAAFTIPAGKITMLCRNNSNDLDSVCSGVTVLAAEKVGTVVKQ
jgi:hypothetical protein